MATTFGGQGGLRFRGEVLGFRHQYPGSWPHPWLPSTTSWWAWADQYNTIQYNVIQCKVAQLSLLPRVPCQILMFCIPTTGLIPESASSPESLWYHSLLNSVASHLLTGLNLTLLICLILSNTVCKSTTSLNWLTLWKLWWGLHVDDLSYQNSKIEDFAWRFCTSAFLIKLN